MHIAAYVKIRTILKSSDFHLSNKQKKKDILFKKG